MHFDDARVIAASGTRVASFPSHRRLCLNERVCGSRFRSADPTGRIVLSSVAILIEQDRMAACYCSNEESSPVRPFISRRFIALQVTGTTPFPRVDIFLFCPSFDSTIVPMPRSPSFLVNTVAQYLPHPSKKQSLRQMATISFSGPRTDEYADEMKRLSRE